MKRPQGFLLISLLLAGCGGELTSPEPIGGPEDPSYIALLLPAVQKVQEPLRIVATEDGTEMFFQIQQALFDDGRAVGTARLREVADPSIGYHFRFQEGRLGCESGLPVVHLRAIMHAGPNSEPVRFILRPTSSSTAGIHLLPYVEQENLWPHLPRERESIRFEADVEVLFASDPCTS